MQSARTSSCCQGVVEYLIGLTWSSHIQQVEKRYIPLDIGDYATVEYIDARPVAAAITRAGADLICIHRRRRCWRLPVSVLCWGSLISHPAPPILCS